MSRMLTIAQRELSSMFRVPAGWVIIALFAFLTAVLFVNQTLLPGQPGSLRYFFMYAGWLLIPIAPAISMRLMSEEYRSGSFEALRTAPAGDWSVTLGKYLGSVAFLVLMLIPTLVYPLVLFMVSEPQPDVGPIFAGYLMLALVGMLYLAIGMLASAMTASQTLAFLGTVMSLILLMVLTSVIADQLSVRWAIVLRSLSITTRVGELAKGVIDTSTIAFFLIGCLWMLVLAAGTLEIRRLGCSRAYTIGTCAIFILATASAAGFAGYAAHLKHTRIDVTATGAHELSPRATRIVERLTDPTEIVLAVSHNTTDPMALDLVSDVLEAYDQASELVQIRIIDLDSAEGLRETKELLRGMTGRDHQTIEANLRAINETAELMAGTAPRLAVLSERLEAVRDSISPTTSTNANNRAVFEQRAAIVRMAARDLQSQSEQIREQVTPFINGETDADDLFPFDTYVEPLERALAQLLNQLDDLGTQLDSFANAEELTAAPRAVAEPLVEQAESLRDQMAGALDRITRIEPVDALRVARALETGETLLVIGPPEQGVAAVDVRTLFPTRATLERANVSAAGVIGPRTQELIASAMARLVAPAQPILIFVHGGQPGELLGNSQLFTKTVQRLIERGIDCAEWAAIESPRRPDLDRIDPLGNRPRVFLTIAVDSTAQTNTSGLSGAKRAEAMGEVVSKLIAEGENLIVSLNPSNFPAAGSADPLASALAPFGIVPESGQTLLHERMGPMGRIADPVTVLVPQTEGHSIAGAIRGLNTVLSWAIPIELQAKPGVHSAPLLELAGSDDLWAESAWLNLWRRSPQSRQVMPNQPIFNANEDVRRENWILAAAAERQLAGAPQRVVVVGSNGWVGDAVLARNEQVIDGRVTSQWAGNGALFDASISWLANMDDLIGPGTQARPIATVKPLDPRQLSTIGWVLMAGMPGLILLLGMASRLVFG